MRLKIDVDDYNNNGIYKNNKCRCLELLVFCCFVNTLTRHSIKLLNVHCTVFCAYDLMGVVVI